METVTMQHAKKIAADQMIHHGWIPALARWMVDQVVAEHPNRPDAYHALTMLYVKESMGGI